MSKWPVVPLRELLKEQKERVGTFDADQEPLLGVSNVTGLHRSDMPRIGDMSRYLRVEKNWFAYNPMRINVGSIGWAETESQTGVISPDYVVFSCNEKVEPKLVYWFLKNRRGLKAINSETAGSVRERLYFEALSRIEFPLPPLHEQSQLVKRIDALVAKIEEATRLRKEADQASWTLAFAPYRVIPAPKPGGQPHVLGDFIERHDSGWSPRCDEAPAAEGQWGVLKTTCVQWDGFQSSQNKALLAGMKPRPEITVREDDVLITRAGPVNRVGVSCRVSGTFPRLMLSDKIVRMQTKKELVPEYLVAFFASPFAQDYFRQGKTGLAASQVNISREKLLRLPIHVPSIEEQLSLLQDINGIRQQVVKVANLQTLLTAELDAILSAVLDRAFQGEL